MSKPNDNWPLERIVADLRGVRERWRQARQRHPEVSGREFPSRDTLQAVVHDLYCVLFPLRLGPPELRQQNEDAYVGYTLDRALTTLRAQVELELKQQPGPQDLDAVQRRAHQVVLAFAGALPKIREALDADVEAAFRGDPAARSVDEVLLCYPGVRAMIHHRLAHPLFVLEVPLLARIIAEIAHAETGIDIHPGATIAPSFFIDHGTGVVIGETAVIGQRVRIYQAVTLGAKRFEQTEDGSLRKGEPRHPLLEDDVVIYAGATLLGRITIGRGSVIGGNVWLTRSVPPGSQVSQAGSLHEPRTPVETR